MERFIARHQGKLIPSATGLVVPGATLVEFDELQVIKFGEREYYLIYLLGGKELTDTFHDSFEAALDQANFEFGLSVDQWQLAGEK